MTNIIRTFTGNHVDLDNFRSEDIDLADIVMSLSNQNRYMGHTSAPWPVNQHLMLSSGIYRVLVEKFPEEGFSYDKNTERAVFLHDVPETWYQDLVAPIKKVYLGDHGSQSYMVHEDNAMREVCIAFGVDYEGVDWGLVKVVDNLAYVVESVALRRNFNAEVEVLKELGDVNGTLILDLYRKIKPYIDPFLIELVQKPKDELRTAFFESLMAIAYEGMMGVDIPTDVREKHPDLQNVTNLIGV